MFVLGYFLLALAKLIGMACNILYFILVIRVLLSWIPTDPFNPLVQMLYKITDPILIPIRRVLPQMGAIDLSPIVAFMILYFCNTFFVNVLVTMGSRLI